VKAICAAAGVVALLSGAPDIGDARMDRTEQWFSAVTRHRPGVLDDALHDVSWFNIPAVQMLMTDAQTVVALMRRPSAIDFRTTDGKKQIRVSYAPGQVERLRALAKRLAPRELNEALSAQRVSEILKRAALLETDLAMLRVTEPLTPGAAGTAFRFRIQLADGHPGPINQSPVHWDLARKMLELLPDPSHDAMVRAWYIATIAYNENREEHETVHVSQALALFPDDATVLFFAGGLHQAYASERIQAVVRRVHLPPGMSVDVGSAHSELQLAEKLFRKAVAADPENSEIRLHLGRVLGLLGHHPDAAAELQRAAAAIDDPLNQYYAALFLGAEQEALGQLDAARTSYERAAEFYPGTQSPYLALSQLAWRRGDRQAALDAIRQAIDAYEGDPWWIYDVAHVRHADALLDALWKPFRAEPGP